MKNIKSVIRKNLKNNNNEHLIYIRYTYNRRFILISSSIYVIKMYWNPNAGRVRKSLNNDKKNSILENIENEVEKIVLDLISKNLEPTLYNVKKDYNNKYNLKSDGTQTGGKKINEKNFFKDFQEFIEDKEQKEMVSLGTIKTYKTTKNKLDEFQKDRNISIDYSNIDNDLYENFLNFMRKQGLVDNSVDKHVKNLKLFMKYTMEKGFHNNTKYITFKRTKTKADFVVLDSDELRKLYFDYKPSSNQFAEIRDAFIFGCVTGLRFGDLSKLTSGNFKIKRDMISNKINQDANDSYISVPVQKTTDFIRIPFNPFICDMIEKYQIGISDPSFLQQKHQVFNKSIKLICAEAGMIEKVKVSKRVNNKLVSEEKPKYQFVSSHTMRRSFITILSSMTEITNIQAVSGHKNIEVLSGYIKHSDKELNSVMACFREIFDDGKINVNGQNQNQEVKANVIKSRVVLKSNKH